jgi:uncharacterized protein
VDSRPSIPLFPLRTVLFPGGPLKLRIFEARYLDMIGRCMREATPFGVVLILEGSEAGEVASTATVGTLATVVDFERLEDGLLGITARGGRRFRVLSIDRQSDGLNLGSIEWHTDEPPVALPERHGVLAEVLRQALSQVAMLYPEAEAAYDDAGWVGSRLAEILPFDTLDKQACLEMIDPVERLDFVRARLDIRL